MRFGLPPVASYNASPQPNAPTTSETPAISSQGEDALVLQLRLVAAVVRLGGARLVAPSPSRPGDNKSKPGDRIERQTCEQSADLGNAEHAGCKQAQAASATGLLSFALLPAANRS